MPCPADGAEPASHAVTMVPRAPCSACSERELSVEKNI